jgi:hypothetical protein
MLATMASPQFKQQMAQEDVSVEIQSSGVAIGVTFVGLTAVIGALTLWLDWETHRSAHSHPNDPPGADEPGRAW